MTAIERCIVEQRSCANYLASDEGSPSERRGAQQGATDWLMEEILIRSKYKEFLKSKRIASEPVGFRIPPESLNPKLLPFQSTVVPWALWRGRAALFEDCGLGKTFQQLEWARCVCEKTSGSVLILAPLAVASQTKAEGEKFGIAVTLCRSGLDVRDGINVTNYDRLHHFDPAAFTGIVLDESSILKAFDGKTRKAITEFATNINYRLACTATPSPNDYMELGNHSEFLDIMSHREMLATFFVHDGGDTAKWRLKRHAEQEFWKWVCSWAIAIRKPSDIGFDDAGFDLPALNMHQIVVESARQSDTLFNVEAKTLDERRAARKDSITDRVSECARLVNASTEPWLIWCNLNAESAAIAEAIPGAVEVWGDQEAEEKESALRRFQSGEIRVLASKPSICGHGMNFQHCRNVAFVGLSDSYEQFYQAVRRCWRYGQSREVDCYVITAETEGAVVRNIQEKEAAAKRMMDEMARHMETEMKANLSQAKRMTTAMKRETASGQRWTALMGDCVEACAAMERASIDYSIFSPPFASLYTYSNSDRDMGNVRSWDEFAEHFQFLVTELYRVLKPGRLLSFHCMNLPRTKERDGVIGLHDWRGDMIRTFVGAGFVYHSEVVIWKDPVTAMQRTKAIGLLYKQLRKDSCISRQGIPDYLVTMRKPGENAEPVTKTHEGFPVDRWQRYASPVWMDINPSDTLQRESAREQEDERHICPLQLGVIRRAVELWTNEDDVVLSPFMGIGSEGYVALQMGRRFTGVELKESYWRQACRNLKQAEMMKGSQLMLGADEPELADTRASAQ